jgi:hypothetical protein
MQPYVRLMLEVKALLHKRTSSRETKVTPKGNVPPPSDVNVKFPLNLPHLTRVKIIPVSGCERDSLDIPATPCHSPLKYPESLIKK